MRLVCAFFMLGLFLQGCTVFTPPLEQPVIEEKLNARFLKSGKVGTLSLTPERRVVLVNFTNNRFCAEAPTEVGLDLAALRQLTAKLSADDKAKIGGDYLSTLASKNNVLNRRTQGMQLFLANAYFTCQMYMNGKIDEAQLLEMQFMTLQIVEPLIKEEIRYMYQSAADGTGTKPQAGTSAPSSTASEMGQKLREDAKMKAEAVLKKGGKPKEIPANEGDAAAEDPAAEAPATSQ